MTSFKLIFFACYFTILYYDERINKNFQPHDNITSTEYFSQATVKTLYYELFTYTTPVGSILLIIACEFTFRRVCVRFACVCVCIHISVCTNNLKYQRKYTTPHLAFVSHYFINVKRNTCLSPAVVLLMLVVWEVRVDQLFGISEEKMFLKMGVISPLGVHVPWGKGWIRGKIPARFKREYIGINIYIERKSGRRDRNR